MRGLRSEEKSREGLPQSGGGFELSPENSTRHGESGEG